MGGTSTLKALAEAIDLEIVTRTRTDEMWYNAPMNNPWEQLSDHPPFILPSDEQVLHAYNTKVRLEYQLRFELYPEPFIGNPDASVILLALNPGFDPNSDRTPTVNRDINMYRNNLCHQEQEYPFYLLNPGVGGGGYIWWTGKLRPLIQLPLPQDFLACNVFAIEYFPYHSKKWHYKIPRVPSQEYSFYLVRKAMQRNATIIIMRSYKLWTSAIPELLEYPLAYKLNSCQKVVISPKNCPLGFIQVVKTLKSIMSG